MKAFDNGHHIYELDNFEVKTERGQLLRFIHKEPIAEGSTELNTVHDGTTNEEVLAMLIHRTGRLQDKFPSRENALAITKMQEALMWFEKRTKDRMARGVEGKQIA